MSKRSLTIACVVLLLVVALPPPAHAQPPAAPVRGLAAGDVLGSDLTFTWAPVATATWYHLMVQDTSGVKLDAWYTTVQAHCGAGEPSCDARVNLTLAAGVVYWWVQSYSPSGYSPWSTRGEFNAAGVLQSSDALKNTFVGLHAGTGSPTGDYNTGIGDSALQGLTSGELNTAVGALALTNATSGYRNTAVGAAAMGVLTEGIANTAVGVFALENISAGEFNTAVGHDVLSSLSSGAENTAVGTSALTGVTTGTGNVAIGPDAFKFGNANYNVAIGYHPLSAGSNSGLHNIAIGSEAMRVNTTGESNVAIGAFALRANTLGAANVAIGKDALRNQNTGLHNVAIGLAAMASTTAAFDNTAVGAGALIANTTGEDNTALGRVALPDNTTGDANIAVGLQAGDGLATGNSNIYIGSPAGSASESFTIRIGTTHAATHVAGIFGVTSAGGAAVFVNSSGKLGTFTSSARYKRNVRDIGDASRALLGLRPVTFQYNPALDPEGLTQYGLIAEEVAKVSPELVVMAADGTPETVRYHLLVPLLLNELQRARADVTRHAAAVEAQARQVEALLERVAALEVATRPER